jgi:hypothetical protein
MPILLKYKILNCCCSSQRQNDIFLKYAKTFKTKKDLINYLAIEEYNLDSDELVEFKEFAYEHYNKGFSSSGCDYCGVIYVYGDTIPENLELRRDEFIKCSIENDE